MAKLFLYQAPSMGPTAVVKADGVEAAMGVLLTHPHAASLRGTASGVAEIRNPSYWREIPQDEQLIYLVEFWD